MDEVLAWAVEVSTGQELCCSVLETEGHLIEALTGAGFERVDGGPFFTHHTMSLTELDDPVLEEGFTLRYVEQREADERAACHRTAWSDFGSRVSARSYGQVMNTWPYRPGLDWVVQAPDGEMVANALGWIDAVNGVGLLEPVGCSPAFRRRGLAKAVNRAVLRSLGDAGATTAVVGPRGDGDYPVPAMLYRSIGFEPQREPRHFDVLVLPDEQPPLTSWTTAAHPHRSYTCLVARLILLNGPPGSGKSTIAQAYVDDHPMALNLDIDLVRRLLGQWQEHQEASGLLARAMALAMAREHLRAGHDVVIPQYVARLHFIEQVEELAVECNAEFHEIVLLGNRDASLRRVVRRSEEAAIPAHVEAQDLVDRNGSLPDLEQMYDRLLLVIDSRPRARIIETVDGQIARAYSELLRSFEH